MYLSRNIDGSDWCYARVAKQIQPGLSGSETACTEGKKKIRIRLGFDLERPKVDGDNLPASWDGSPSGPFLSIDTEQLEHVLQPSAWPVPTPSGGAALMGKRGQSSALPVRPCRWTWARLGSETVARSAGRRRGRDGGGGWVCVGKRMRWRFRDAADAGHAVGPVGTTVQGWSRGRRSRVGTGRRVGSACIKKGERRRDGQRETRMFHMSSVQLSLAGN
jgi:hypothetical protein